ncbi:MAG TPA: fluoride efflux transporter CrcB, partial [Burkholderiaceae bacterium]
MSWLAVAVGAALGALLRWRVGVLFNTLWWGFPLGTLVVNVLGGFAIGIALAWLGHRPNDLAKLLLVTGFLGGLTTFSAFSGESLVLLQRGHFSLALLHTLVHVLGA